MILLHSAIVVVLVCDMILIFCDIFDDILLSVLLSYNNHGQEIIGMRNDACIWMSDFDEFCSHAIAMVLGAGMMSGFPLAHGERPAQKPPSSNSVLRRRRPREESVIPHAKRHPKYPSWKDAIP